MPDNSLQTVEIEKLVAGGDGLFRLNGKVFFVPGVITGEQVQVEITSQKKDMGHARVVSWQKTSPHRVKPRCVHYDECGGCSWQHLDYEQQLNEKLNIMNELMMRVGRIAVPEKTEIRGADAYGYRIRCRMEYIQLKNRKIKGYRQAKSNRIIDVKECPVLNPALEKFVLTHKLKSERGEVQYLLGDDVSVFEGGGAADPKAISVKLKGFELKADAGIFFQSNQKVLELLINDLRPWLGGERVLDLYAGCGTFTRLLTDYYKQVDAVEHNTHSLKYLEENTIGKANCFSESVEDFTNRNPDGEWDLIIVDPPRSGLSKEIKQWLMQSRAPRIVYVSCDPATFARDSGELKDYYSLTKLTAYDFYPQTPHLEVMGILEKNQKSPE